MRPGCLESVVAGGVLLLVSVQASAQPLFSHAVSIECTVINADIVVVGKLVEFSGEREDGWTATIAVEETLKGEHRPLRRLRLGHHPASVLAKWKDQMSQLLLAAKERSPAAGSARVIDLASEELAVLTVDFTLLRKADAVVRMAKEAARRMPGVTRISTFDLTVPRETVAGTKWTDYYCTGGYLTLQVPIDNRLEKRAHEFVHSDNYMRRGEGARALRYFKSDENVARVKSLLDDQEWAYGLRAEENKGLEVRIYGVRKQAYETLEYWGVKAERPLIREEVVKLESVRTAVLSKGEVTDVGLKELARFDNLQNLILWNTEITDEKLSELAALKNLRKLYLGGTKVTDRGLKHLAGLINLQYLDLSGTKVTDRGLKQLGEFKSLQKLDLGGAQVTDDGVAQLRKLRPDLKIQR